MDKKILDVKSFLDNAKSMYHAVALLEDMLKKDGYQKLAESEQWELARGGKYYTVRGGRITLRQRSVQQPQQRSSLPSSRCPHP